MSDNKSLSFYAPIEKTDDEQRMVFGYASTEALDSQGEVVKKDALKDAIGDYMKFANIREMHQPSAVGKTKQAQIDSKGLYIAAKVVDDKAWEKVKEGVYNGFSIGGRVKTMVENEITGLTLSEISLVDRPANPEATFDVWKMDSDEAEKRDFSDKERQSLADSGKALPDGSFPIVNESDLRNAIRAIGRAKDPAKAKAHIKSRAKALGREDLIPDSWKADTEEDIQKDACDATEMSAMADHLNRLISEEEAEGDEVTVKALKAAQQALKDAAISELHEDEDSDDDDDSGMDMAYADKTEDLAKADEETEEKEETVEENNEAEETKEEETGEENSESTETTEDTDTKEEENGASEEANQEEVAEDKEVADKATDIVKAVDALIVEGKMPTDDQIDELLKAQDIPVNNLSRDAMRYEIAGLIVKAIEAQLNIQKEQDELRSKANDELNNTPDGAKTDEEKVTAKKILSLVEKAEELMKQESQGAYTQNEGEMLPPAPNSGMSTQFSNVTEALTALQAAVEFLSQNNAGGAFTQSEQDAEENGKKGGSTMTGGGQAGNTSKPNTEFKNSNTGVVQNADLETAIQKIETLTKEVEELKNQPLPIKVKASYQVVEKKFEGGDSADKKTELLKAEKRADELHELMKADPYNQTLQQEAQTLSANIMKLRREVVNG